MKNWLRYLKNKYVLTLVLFGAYSLLLDENDIFSVITQKRKLSAINEQKAEMQSNLDEVNNTLKRLKYTAEVERFAREKKFFKKDNEDVFVITAE